jgi:hypothetical protein
MTNYQRRAQRPNNPVGYTPMNDEAGVAERLLLEGAARWGSLGEVLAGPGLTRQPGQLSNLYSFIEVRLRRIDSIHK